jgi:NAD(P)-dependent dehydrogenase (short-subunit alcohol dehydrogenase family)
VVPVRLDITDPGQVAAAAARCGDVNILVNNAGIMRRTPLLAAPDTAAARAEMETNY